MKNKIWEILCIASAAVFLLTVAGFILVQVFFTFQLSKEPNAGIAIIGDADGPTASWLTVNLLFHTPLGFAFLIISSLCLVVFLLSFTVLLLRRFRRK